MSGDRLYDPIQPGDVIVRTQANGREFRYIVLGHAQGRGTKLRFKGEHCKAEQSAHWHTPGDLPPRYHLERQR